MPSSAGLSPDTALLVRPVHLSGPGDPRLVTTALDTAPGWTKARTADGVRYVSPCQLVHVAHLPDSHHGGWAVRGHRTPTEALWGATFGDGTPAEITAAFTTTLVDGLRSNHRDYLIGGQHHLPGTPAAVLADRGWLPAPGTKGFHDQVSPDGHALYRHRVGYQTPEAELDGEVPASWTMTGGPTGGRWQADFTAGVPFYLLTRAALALSSAEPVARRFGAIPGRSLPHVTARLAAAPARPRRPYVRPAPTALPPTAVSAATGARRR